MRERQRRLKQDLPGVTAARQKRKFEGSHSVGMGAICQGGRVIPRPPQSSKGSARSDRGVRAVSVTTMLCTPECSERLEICCRNPRCRRSTLRARQAVSSQLRATTLLVACSVRPGHPLSWLKALGITAWPLGLERRSAWRCTRWPGGYERARWPKSDCAGAQAEVADERAELM
ncbi:hypothetical protein OH77DRAFT_484715 [Trametes cingulata]|nr:hypothetical protein OH77DRAFT_484715 [Trametes cingulata]